MFIRYYRAEGDSTVTYDGFTYSTPEELTKWGWPDVINQWVPIEHDWGDGNIWVEGYLYVCVLAGPFDNNWDASVWWYAHEWEYDPNVEKPQ